MGLEISSDLRMDIVDWERNGSSSQSIGSLRWALIVSIKDCQRDSLLRVVSGM